MDNQHRKIKGYRELSEEEIALMNEIKEEGERLRVLCEKISELGIYSGAPAYRKIYTGDPSPFLQYRWLEDGAMDLQTGLMKITRAVARPTTF